MAVAEVGRGGDGTCKITQGVPKDSPGVQSSAAGNVFGFSVSKMSDRENLVGFVVTADGESTINPSPAIYSQGTYEYLKLGQPVRKTFSVLSLGMNVTKTTPGT